MDRYYFLRCVVMLAATCVVASVQYGSKCSSVKLPAGMTTVTTKWDYCKDVKGAHFFWNYDATTFTCAVVTPKGSYVGVGFKVSETEGMWGADIYVGFNNSLNQNVLEDMISVKPAGATGEGGRPTKDATQNGRLLSISHVGTKSLFEFSRPLAAADQQDVTIDPTKKIEILWASGAVQADRISNHGTTNRGHAYVDLSSGATSIYNLTTVCLTIMFSWIVQAL
ncbi:uncharacterized protein LOC135483227 [Lineus longissimus]|uniref:uncharacterized protein LOC135483227 n=1 Tax=Lineus longissimus TaxID=88925 RepID=UPI00315D32DC